MVILAVSRSEGISTTDSMPARAAWAATELARFPVEAHAATLKPSWRALVSATDTTRSLNDPVGLAVSSLIHNSPSPSSAARRSARTRGVHPAPRSTGAASVTGRRSAYRQIDLGPAAILSLVMVAATFS